SPGLNARSPRKAAPPGGFRLGRGSDGRSFRHQSSRSAEAARKARLGEPYIVVVVVVLVVVVMTTPVVEVVVEVVVVGAAEVLLVVVVGVTCGQAVLSSVGFFTLKSLPSTFVTLLPVLLNSTEYRSPAASLRATQPLSPGSGGKTATAPFFAVIFTLIKKTPLFVRLMIADFTGPFVPFGSLYLKPWLSILLQEPWGRV